MCFIFPFLSFRDGPTSPDRKIVRNRQFQDNIQEEEIEMPTHLPPDVERKSVRERISVRYGFHFTMISI